MICPINSYQKMSGDKVEKVDKIKSCFNLIKSLVMMNQKRP